MKLTNTQKLIILAVVALLLIAVVVICIVNGSESNVPVPTGPSGSESVSADATGDSHGEQTPSASGTDEATGGEINTGNEGSGDIPVVTDPVNPNKPTDPSSSTKPTSPTEPSVPEGSLGVGIWDETTAPTENSDGTKPTVKPTEPTTKPTEPTTKPTEPTTKPTEPTTKPTEPTTKPTEPTTKPTEPTTKPTEPTTKPTEPEKEKLTYLEYEALKPAEKQAYMEEVFGGDVKAFIQWYNEAKAEYEASTEPVPTYNGGDINIGDLIGKN